MISRIFWLFMSILWGFITILLGLEVWHARASSGWPITQGVVVAFYATPEYKYSVKGQTYLSSHASCNELFNYQVVLQNSEKYASAYPLGAKVTVHYCPQKPSLAVLETRFDSLGYLVLTVLLFTTLVFIAGFIFGWRLKWSWRRFPQTWQQS